MLLLCGDRPGCTASITRGLRQLSHAEYLTHRQGTDVDAGPTAYLFSLFHMLSLPFARTTGDNWPGEARKDREKWVRERNRSMCDAEHILRELSVPAICKMRCNQTLVAVHAPVQVCFLATSDSHQGFRQAFSSDSSYMPPSAQHSSPHKFSPLRAMALWPHFAGPLLMKGPLGKFLSSMFCGLAVPPIVTDCPLQERLALAGETTICNKHLSSPAPSMRLGFTAPNRAGYLQRTRRASDLATYKVVHERHST